MAKKDEILEENSKTEKEEILRATKVFIDKNTRTQYEKGTEFIIADVKETEKIGDKKYKISKARAEQIKAKGFIE